MLVRRLLSSLSAGNTYILSLDLDSEGSDGSERHDFDCGALYEGADGF